MSTSDIVIFNARVLPMDGHQTRASAVALAAGKVRALGNDAQILALAEDGARVINAHGRTLLPGFIESHLHLFTGAGELGHLQLLGIEGYEALCDAVRAYAAKHPQLPVIVGQGCDYDVVDRSLTRQDLDAILPDRPVCLLAADHHTAWANTVALKRAGILEGRSLGPGNEIVMGDDGLAMGELREFQAKAPVLALAGAHRIMAGLATGKDPDPYPTAQEFAADCEIMAQGLEYAARLGLTSLTNMDGNPYTLRILEHLRTEGRLTARVKVPFHYASGSTLADLDIASQMGRDYCDDWLSSGFVKLFMDGVIDSGTAVMVHDYPDRAGWRGEPLWSEAEFAAIATEADRRGLQIAVHAIGDGAVRRVLDGYEQARVANGARDARHRIEHIELIDPEDIARLRDLGVTASIQPIHAPGASDFPLQPTMNKIGQARWGDAYLHRTLADAGIPLAFASDWPVADLNPLRGIQSALERPVYEGAADERLPLHDILAAYTTGGAYATHSETRKGQLRAGYLADLVILNGDIETATPTEIGAMQVDMTICGGQIVWEQDSAF
ncbi:MAG: amidohydrolase [Natronohydrobacter sp.]|nr:amidohydrolase [Natronohydrobacter sp.]